MGPNHKVYYQPPENLKLSYPCIVYNLATAKISHADNKPYAKFKRYNVTLITKTADNDEYLDQLLDLPTCYFERQYVTDGLVHSLFDVYF